MALGYEDPKDYDQLASDKLLAVVMGETDPTGMDRKSEQDEK